MPANVISLHPIFDPVRVELSSPGTQRGLPFYVIDLVKEDGERACMWAGTDRGEALAAAIDCTEGGLVAIDLTGTAPRPLLTGAVH